MKTKFLNVVILIVLIFGTLFFLLRDQELDQLLSCIQSADKLWLLAGLACIILYICFESVIIHYIFNALSYSSKLINCIVYSFIGFFVSAITPSSSGGQPAQMYFMKKDKISVSISSLVLMVVTVTFKASLLILAAIMLIVENGFVMEHIKGIEFILVFGVTVNVVVIVFLMLVIFRQSMAKRMVGKIVLFLGAKKLIKNPDAKLKKILASISKYDRGAAFLKSHKLVFINAFILTFIQRMMYFLITYTVYRSFGLHGCSVFEIITLQLIITLAVDNLPWPGGMGVNEGIFIIFFTEIFTESYVTAGLILTRGFNYYFVILAGGIITAVAKIVKGKKVTNDTAADNFK